MPEPRDGALGEDQIDKLLTNPDALNDPAAVKSLAERGIVGSNTPPAEDEPAEEPEADAGADAGTEDGADAGDASGTAGEEPPAPDTEDPATKAIRLEAENRIYREMLDRKPVEEEPKPVPVAKPAHVVEWEKLAAVDKQTARAHYEKLTADGLTFDADQFLAAWQNAPGQLAQYREQEAFRNSLVEARNVEAKAKAAAELKALSKAHPDWEKYADVMEDLAKRDAAAQKAGMPSAYSTMEELYQEAFRKKGGTPTAALSPADAKRKAALGRGPSSRRGGTAAGGGGGTKPNPEQELIRSILRDDVRI